MATSKIRGGEASSPQFEAPVELLGDREAMRMEIDAGGRRSSGLDGGSTAPERGEGERRCGLEGSSGRLL
jgi:hypothetical protein